MLFFRKLLQIPGPKELGKSKIDALPMRNITPDCEGYTWEDYDEEISQKFPIRNFIANTLVDFIRNKIWFPIDHFKYWLVSHIVPKHRYHMLDLRQPCDINAAINIDCYRYGWCDVPEKMLYAMFNLLKEYFDENPFNLRSQYSEEEIELEPHLKLQQSTYDEAKAILYWWQVERKEESKRIDQLLHSWSELNHNKETRDNGKAKEAFAELNAAEAIADAKIDEMTARLLKIRRSLWT